MTAPKHRTNTTTHAFQQAAEQWANRADALRGAQPPEGSSLADARSFQAATATKAADCQTVARRLSKTAAWLAGEGMPEVPAPPAPAEPAPKESGGGESAE